MSSFHREREIKTLKSLEEIKSGLPPFCNRFFLGISQTTSPLTRLNYAYELRQFFEFLSVEVDIFIGYKMHEYDLTDLDKIMTFHIELFVNQVRNGEKGIMRKLACLRTFFKYFYKRDEITTNAPAKVDMPKLHDKPIVRLDKAEMMELIKTVNNGEGLSKGQQRFHDLTTLRDETIIILFLTTGLRISELVGLNLGDLDLQRGSFKITRKGGNQVILYMPDELKTQLILFLGLGDGMENRDLTDQTRNEPLFKSIQSKRISVRAVQNLVGKYARLAVPLKSISPHKLRSTFGTNLYRDTKDIYIVADVLGHRDVNTTKKHYAAISEDVRRDAATKVKLFDEEN